MLRDDYQDGVDTCYADVVNATNARVNAHDIQIPALQDAVDDIPTVNDSLVAGFVNADGSLTRAAIESHYALPPELETGPPPTVRAHANAGTGATVAYGGTKMLIRVTITTGVAPEQGGILAEIDLVGYTLAPVVMMSATSVSSSALNPYHLVTPTLIQIIATSEIEPGTAYVFDLIIMGY